MCQSLWLPYTTNHKDCIVPLRSITEGISLVMFLSDETMMFHHSFLWSIGKMSSGRYSTKCWWFQPLCEGLVFQPNLPTIGKTDWNDEPLRWISCWQWPQIEHGQPQNDPYKGMVDGRVPCTESRRLINQRFSQSLPTDVIACIRGLNLAHGKHTYTSMTLAASLSNLLVEGTNS